MGKINQENQGMLKILQDISILLKDGKSIKAKEIREKTGLELKHWVKLRNNRLIIDIGKSCNKPLYKWDTIRPNIYMAIETLKDVPDFYSPQIFFQDFIPESKDECKNENTNKIEGNGFVSKEIFIKNNSELCNIAFNEGDHKTYNAKKLIKLARDCNLYSPNTISQDVFNLLKKHADRMKLNDESPIIKDKEIKKVIKIPPDIKDVADYCVARKNDVNPDKWFAYYESKDWMIGKNKMTNWKAAIHTWEQKAYNTVFVNKDKISEYTDQELINELKKRGYKGNMSKDITF